MTNKLLEIKQAWIKENEDYLLGWGLSMEVIESIGDDIVKNAAEYARSKVPNERISITDSALEAQDEGYELCRDEMLYSIDQDLLSLKEKNI